MSNVYKQWEIEITQKIEDNKNKGAWIIDVQAVKGEETKARNFHGIISQAMLTQAVKGWIDTVESAKSVTESVDLTEPVKEEPVAPTQAELDKQEWDKDRETLRQAMELVRDGVFPADQASIVALQKKVRDGFKTQYLG